MGKVLILLNPLLNFHHNVCISVCITILLCVKSVKDRDFAGGAVVKNPPASAGDTGSIPGLGRSHMPRSN